MSKNITRKDVEDIAQLARIELQEDEAAAIADSFGPIMEMIEKVNSVEVGEEVQRDFTLKNIVREDEVRDNSSEDRKEIVANFPDKKDNYLKTKKVL